MKSRKAILSITLYLVTLFLFTLPFTAAASSMTLEELSSRVKQQEREIDQLKNQMDATADMVDAGAGRGSSNKTTLGGYGELHYNNLDVEDDADKKELDFHRFVLFIGHRYSEKIKLFTEFELEHALASKAHKGEVELEQAYIDMEYVDNHTLRAGLFLVPVGILNETHEPPTFYGTERNPVEKNIVPSTWWEGGFALTGNIVKGLKYDLALTSGLNVGASPAKVRDGRQKVAKAKAENEAITGRIKWLGIPGVEVAATLQHQEDITQGEASSSAGALLTEVHTVINKGGFGLRALYAKWDIDNDSFETDGYDEQKGGYLEASYKFGKHIGIFARRSEWDNQAGNSVVDSEMKQTDFGINIWPDENVVIKFDIQNQDTDSNETDGYNIGVGYQF
ncbi:MAG: porin [Deltaproteobacteria bacterium]|nr:porin [Deltaproteobacteria bacterium]